MFKAIKGPILYVSNHVVVQASEDEKGVHFQF